MGFVKHYGIEIRDAELVDIMDLVVCVKALPEKGVVGTEIGTSSSVKWGQPMWQPKEDK